MKMEKDIEKIRNCSSLDELVDVQYGKQGTPERDLFDAETHEFCVAQTLREERIRAGLTQEQLAQMLGTKKAYISRVENGKQNLNLTTLYRIFGCLGKKVSITLI